MNNAERRISERVEANFDVNYIHRGDYLISQTRDISIDGMFLYTRNPLIPHNHTTLTFSLGNLHDQKVEAEVMWANRSESKDAGMAVKFVGPSKELQKAILEIVNKVAILDKQ